MENLKALISDALKQRIGESTPDNLLSTSSSLLDFFHQLPPFHQIVGDLTDPERALCRKSEKSALEYKLKGNDCFSRGDYSDAVRFYSQALRVSPVDVDDMAKSPVATLYVNRASAFYKMNLLVECVRDTGRALSVCPGYAKAWFRRGKANASLGNYEDAIRDLNISLNLETSLSGKRQIESEMKRILDQSKETSHSMQKSNESNSPIYDEPCQIKLQYVSTRTKGRGMVSLDSIPEASLIHKEDPYAAIILKHCRETHCHFCFSELPIDAVPCSSCSIPLYCSEQCQVRAGGQKLMNIPRNIAIHENFSDDVANYVSDVISVSISDSCLEKFTEHSHECQGVHWPLVLPSEIVLAGRVLVKYIQQQRHSGVISDLGIWDLCNSYAQLPPETKLEFHIYSIILLYCLQHLYGPELPSRGETISQVVILISQIRVNSMAIVRIKSFDWIGSLHQHSEFSRAVDASTTTVEQVRVGQAVYLAGSLFNHSCQPNIHAYFVSRTLYVRATEFVVAGSQLELSYGPQVGQQDCKERQQFLEDRYSFRCECRGCSKLNLSDLVFNAYRCVKPHCFGVVLDVSEVKCEKQKLNSFLGAPATNSPGLVNQVDKLKEDGITKVAGLFGNFHEFKPGYCLNCDSLRNLEASSTIISEAKISFGRLKDAIASSDVPSDMLLDALSSIDLLRKTFHPYNKRIAEVEDCLAQGFCLLGELQAALDHCEKSIEILGKLYGPCHISIGNELIKLASIQLSLGDCTASDSLNQVLAIFSRYYGSHANILFPHLQCLKEEAVKLL